MKSRVTHPIRKVAFAAVSFALGFVSIASAQEVRYRDGRFLETLGGVTIQRADEAGSDAAVLNMPFLPGDRVWTDDSGRAEIIFAEGEILWIAERSKVDSLGRGGPDQDERLGLRVFAGSFGARVRSGGPGFEFRAPGGNISTTGAAAFRVDSRSGETTISVAEGEVLAILGGERMTVRAGERVGYADGRVDGPFRFQRAEADRFDQWCDERFAELRRMARNRNDDRLPDELDPYADELDRHGDWVYDEPQGYVYVPRVAYDWAPYTRGRWVYTLYGWTWVADEPWGFVTSHYGRWGHSSRLGWHWMPRLGFSGAWVGWSSPGGRWSHTIGWCALGFNDRPVGAFAYESNRGAGASRFDARAGSPGRGWSFTNRSDMGRASVQRVRVNVPLDDAERAVVWNAGAAPDRNFREARRGSEGRSGPASRILGDTRAVSRDEGRRAGDADRDARVYVRPSPGDSTPELRSDPATTIPTPESRRRPAIGQDGFKEGQENRRGRSRSIDSSAVAEPAGRPGPSSVRASRADPDPPPSQSPADEDAARASRDRERATRDPLLSRFFRSITRPSSTEREYAPPPGDDGSARRREAQPRNDPPAREVDPPDRSRSPATRSPDARPTDENRSRPRPAGVERTQPRRDAPPPRPTPERISSDEDQRGANRRRPRQER